MAKKKTKAETAPDPEETQEIVLEAAPDKSATTLEIPLAEQPVPGAYQRRHINVQLNTQQARALRRIYDGLDSSGERLQSGRRIASAADCIRWILEQI